jgi:sulfur transfer complex TusBCD TusB component (DsrH family)
MSTYLFFESRSTSESNEVYGLLDLAEQLCLDGHQVELVLIQNGVLMLRGAAEPQICRLAEYPGIQLWVDEFSLQSRLIEPSTLPDSVQVITIDGVVHLLTRPNCKPVWH